MGGLNYELIYMKRKTVSIKVNPDGSVTVKAPNGTKKAFVDALVKRHMMWIEKKREQLSELKEKAESFDFSDDSQLLVFGKNMTVISGEGDDVHIDGDKIAFPVSDKEKRRLMYRCFIKKLLASHLTERINFWSGIMGVKPTKIGITSARTRWGSCSSKNSINFSVYLSALDCECIDLIVVHELSHILVKNHSKDFYDVVDKYIKNRKELEKRIKSVGKSAFGWDK